MTGLAWTLILGAPALVWLALLCVRSRRIEYWTPLACVPALVATLVPPAALSLPAMWPGAAIALTASERPWVGFTALLWACATVYAARDLQKNGHGFRFWTFWMIALTGNLLLLVAQDLATFYVGFSMMSLAGYGLIVHRKGPEPRQAGRTYLQLAILGELLLFSGILMRVQQGAGVTDLNALQALAAEPLSSALLLLGLGLKAGFWPLHIWLPLAHPAAPAAASAVLSGAMIKAGFYGLWRLLPASDALLQSWAPGLLALGFVSIFYGALVGVLQARPKTVLAFSSVSQMGYLLGLLALGWLLADSSAAIGSLLAWFAIHHGLAKGALFMGAGLAHDSRLARWHWLLLCLPALALAGLPLTSGAAVKLLFKDALETAQGPLLVSLLSLGSVGTALLMLRALWLMQQSSQASTSPPPTGQWLAVAVLCLASVALPWVLPGLREPSGYALSSAAWSLIWPGLLALALAWGALRSGMAPASLRRWLPAPARALSLAIRRLTRPHGAHDRPAPIRQLRSAERRLNRLLRLEPVSTSGWLVLAMLFVGWMMAL